MKHLFSFLFFSILSINAFAQQDEFGWRIGGGIGYMSYWGDLSTTNSFGSVLKEHYSLEDQRAFQLSLERRLSPGIHSMFSYQQGTITANDRSNINNPYFARSLNFQTTLRDFHFSFNFGADNDRILSSNFFIAPYLSLGAGLTNFNITSDLKDAAGNFYIYQDNNDLVQDGTFETNITNLGSDIYGNYVELIPNFSAGLGIRFRFLNRFSLHLQTNLHYTLTDHLDDVGEINFRSDYDDPLQAFAGQPNPAYLGPRAKPNGKKDSYISTIASFRISFGRKKEGFKAPIFYSHNIYENTVNKNANSSNQIEELDKKQVTAGTNNSFSNIAVENKALKQELAAMNARLQELEQNPTVNPNQIPVITTHPYWQLPPNYYPPNPQSPPPSTTNQEDVLLKQLTEQISMLNQRLQQLEQSENTTLSTNIKDSLSTPPPIVVTPPTSSSLLLPDYSILFDKNSLVIQTTELKKLEELGTILRDNPNFNVRITGYKAADGNDYYNRKLSHKRVEEVRDRLINAYRVPQEQISILPLHQKTTKSEEVNSTANRRVDITWED